MFVIDVFRLIFKTYDKFLIFVVFVIGWGHVRGSCSDHVERSWDLFFLKLIKIVYRI